MTEPDADAFEHQPIDLGSPAIRLLRILKGRGIMICCQLFQAFLKDPIPYEALSYVWSPDQRDCVIEIDGQPFWVTRALHDALLQLQLPDQDRIVWVDAICIDTNNLVERNHQVQQMKQIYQQASRVVYWLGSPTLFTDDCLYALQVLEKKSRGFACKDWTREQWLDLWKASRGNRPAQQREGLRELLDRPWFRRVWILPEVAHSHAAVVSCGKASVSARIFGIAPYLMGLQPSKHCQALLDMMPGPFRKSSWFGEKRDLATLLEYFGGNEARDPRDLIYALLSIATDDAIDYIKPDYAQNELYALKAVFRFLYRVEWDSIEAASRPTELREFCGRITHYATIALERAIEDETNWEEPITFILQQFPKLPLNFSTLLSAAKCGANASKILEILLTSGSHKRPPLPEAWYPALIKAAESNEATGKQAVEFLSKSSNQATITEDILAGQHLKPAHALHVDSDTDSCQFRIKAQENGTVLSASGARVAVLDTGLLLPSKLPETDGENEPPAAHGMEITFRTYTDSGYGTHGAKTIACSAGQACGGKEGEASRRDDSDRQTIYSDTASLQGPRIHDYVAAFADELAKALPSDFSREELQDMSGALPDILKAFASRIGYEGSGMLERLLRHLVHRYRMRVAHQILNGRNVKLTGARTGG